MPRRPRIEIAGGLYHIITRGNNRRRIFQTRDDYLKFLAFLESQKSKRPFYLYAYCLMPNHVHLLAEMKDDPISRIMQSLLTAYSKFHNRKYLKVGHLFQGRYKAILCQEDRYLAELVRYIHLNPVRAKMVSSPAQYEYSGHRAYLGLDRSGLVDVEPVLRHFGANRKRAVEVYSQFVNAALGQESQSEYYLAAEGRMLGDDEFVDELKHRVGDYVSRRERGEEKDDIEKIVKAAEKATGFQRKEFCSSRKNRQLVMVREAIIMISQDKGIPARELALVLGLDPSAVSKRREAGRARTEGSPHMAKLLKAIRSSAE